MTSVLLVAALLAGQTPPPAPSAAPAAAPPTASATGEGQPAPGPAEAASPPAGDALAALLARVDAAWPRRDEAGQLEASAALLEEAARLAPGDFGVLWRQARHDVWLSEDPRIPDKLKSERGKRAWDLAEKAIAADPARVEGWFYAVGGMGNYSLGIGIFTALSQGIEGKFKDRLSHAERIDPGFISGAIPTAWGRFYYKLPWPKYDGKKSEQHLRAALVVSPDNVRAHVYLGDLLKDEGHKAEARAAWEAALAKPPGQYDAPEERRWQEVARESLARLEKK